MSTQDNHAKQQAAAQYASIAALVHAYNLDWDRLEELREERESLAAEIDNAKKDPEDCDGAELLICEEALAQWEAENAEELAEFEQAKADTECDSQESVQDRIQEMPLEICIRSGWVSCQGDMQAEEFMILLCTGGPAVRIMGELDHRNNVHRAWIEYQDWGTAWTQYFDADQDTLIEFCNHFYFVG